MNACLVVDAGVRRPTIAYVHLHPEPRVADEVALDDGWQSPDIHQLYAPGVELIVHRFRHAPGTTEAERQPDLAAVAAAGALEPRDTAARLA
ncbi:MAG: hypothetical protein HUU35_18125, partial [Armatimonadetes bacterium]|nr:hypothetical protein [Armatimonadota bacterium]